MSANRMSDTLTLTSLTPERPAPRATSKKWAVGDGVIVDGTRWVIREMKGHTVTLMSTSNPNAQIFWTTTLGNLPKKARA